ncbi:PD-(D/E)XK nuclease family protein [Herbidospora daliensis]|uniref:PD-(D/E)XK nuclease family protein n=1 Tax=Herbidospora daliensis TaxID=295585 RepID=UPI000781FABA|nr:PD-(D/E)XK nuclease family protein [Herbidospora daliensis]
MKSLTTADLLLEWDKRRPRSRQRQFGMSELGGCRRRAGYRLAGVEPTNDGGSLPAIMGTGIHEAVSTVFGQMQADGLIPADDLVEHEVEFAGILGHLDRYEKATASLIDVKTTSQRRLDKLKVQGPDRGHLWQTHGYGAALISQGLPVRRIVIDYLARDTGEQWRYVGRFDPQVVRDALAWVAEVRSTELDYLPRDFQPDSPWCEHCPFRDACWEGAVDGRDPRSVLYVEDPDAAGWAAKLEDARARKKAAESDEKTARGALDALRPNDAGVEHVAVPGFGKAIRFTVTSPERLDGTQIRKDYAAAGRPVPVKPGKPEVRLDLVDASDDVFVPGGSQ